MLDAYVRYLAAERGLSAATVTAYTADVAGLLDHLVRFTGAGPATTSDDLTLTVLRSWLARLRTTGAARASLARRAAAARSFTAWAHRTGRLDSDVGARLASPKGGRTLPSVLRVDQAAEMLLPVQARDADGSAGVGEVNDTGSDRPANGSARDGSHRRQLRAGRRRHPGQRRARERRRPGTVAEPHSRRGGLRGRSTPSRCATRPCSRCCTRRGYGFPN